MLLASGFQSAADICLDRSGKFLLVPDMKAGTVTAISTTIPGWEVDETPLPVTVPAEVSWPGRWP